MAHILASGRRGLRASGEGAWRLRRVKQLVELGELVLVAAVALANLNLFLPTLLISLHFLNFKL